MASVHPKGKKGTSWGVSYKYIDDDGVNRLKEETYHSKEAADKRKLEVEYLQSVGKFVPPVEKTVQLFLKDFVDIYGAQNWGPSYYKTATGLINNYINPKVGRVKMKSLTKKKMDAFFVELQTTERVACPGKANRGLVSNNQIADIHSLLFTAFSMAVEWGDIGINPITKKSKPKVKKAKKETLTPAQSKYLVTHCKDMRLLCCLLLALGCSMRIGEVVGLCWSKITLNEEDNFEDAHLEVDRQLQRLDLEALTNTKARKEDIKFIFPVIKQNSSTRLVLRTPKTDSSTRRVWIPGTICKLLLVLKEQQERYKKIYGDKYEDYDLVVTNPSGRPVESNRILEMLQELLISCELPDVDFHSLRHTSTTFKLIITNGDIKSVQGDNGQAVAAMVTDTYSFIIDSNRKNTANLFEREFFGNESENNNTVLTEKQMELFVNRLSANPDMFQKFTTMLTQKAEAFS